VPSKFEGTRWVMSVASPQIKSGNYKFDCPRKPGKLNWDFTLRRFCMWKWKFINKCGWLQNLRARASDVTDITPRPNQVIISLVVWNPRGYAPMALNLEFKAEYIVKIWANRGDQENFFGKQDIRVFWFKDYIYFQPENK